MFHLQLYPLEKHIFSFIDEDMVEEVSKYRWHSHKGKHTNYARTSMFPNGIKKNVYLHRFLMNVKERKDPVDHIDGNGLNNVKSNLRITTTSQNSHNAKLKCTNTSGFNGVFIIERYHFSYRIEGKRTSKSFKTLQQAEDCLKQLGLMYKIQHRKELRFQWYEEKLLKIKCFQDMDELLEFRKITYERIGNTNGVRK